MAVECTRTCKKMDIYIVKSIYDEMVGNVRENLQPLDAFKYI